MDVAFWLNLTGFALLFSFLAYRQVTGGRTTTNVLLALVLGTAFGAALQAIHGLGHESIGASMTWIGVVSSGYVRLLQMIVMPLVLVSILAAVSRLGNASALGKISVGVLGLLLITTAVSALIGVGVSQLFGLSAESIVQGTREIASGERMVARVDEITGQTVPQLLLSFLPTNIFQDLTGARQTSVIAVVVFSGLLGLAVLQLRRKEPEVGERIVAGIDTLQRLVMQLVKVVLRLTPYGVLALMTRMAATSNTAETLTLMRFLGASYVGLAAILLVHAALLALVGLNPLRFYRKSWPVLTFAFSSRSSAATVPFTIDTQTSRLGVGSGVAAFAASFGATIGQNACAGLYPAMLAVMIAPGVGIDPTSGSFLGPLLLVTTLGSVGIAGFGGGATVAAILVLSTLGLPVALAGLLISIEPLIDMGRTAVNVSGAMTAGAVTSRLLGQTDMAVFAAEEPAGDAMVSEPVRGPGTGGLEGVTAPA
jgi:L-cystine uptake protein TcyP (sodium:dicarboxylate symporter family)